VFPIWRARSWLGNLAHEMRRRLHSGPLDIPLALWRPLIDRLPFLANLSNAEQARLRALCSAFLVHKEFSGANGLNVTDAMALAIAAQACVPLLHMRGGLKALDWYGDFVGIVLHPGGVLAHRKSVDEAGVVHHWNEALAGEAMQGGPLTLSWHDVALAGARASHGFNVVIHEFVHVIDMHGKGHTPPHGCPLMPPAHRKQWQAVMQQSYQRFAEASSAAERFGSLVDKPWLDSYAAKSPSEFFAVTAEAYFVARPSFAEHFPELMPLYDGFFRSGG